ncbi:MAG: MarR family winged helix-turn-helix transcriptional regulator [Paracoccaceae bacterium]
MGAIEKKYLIHPKVKAISDGIAFKLARLVAIHEKHGNYNFKKKFGLSLNEWRVLGLANEMEPVFFRDIRVMLNIDKGQLSRAIKTLVKKEILLSTGSREDARLIEITTTLKGKKLHDMMLKFSTDRNEEIVQGLTRSEFKEFVRILEKITNSSISL